MAPAALDAVRSQSKNKDAVLELKNATVGARSKTKAFNRTAIDRLSLESGGEVRTLRRCQSMISTLGLLDGLTETTASSVLETGVHPDWIDSWQRCRLLTSNRSKEASWMASWMVALPAFHSGRYNSRGARRAATRIRAKDRLVGIVTSSVAT